MTLTREFKGTVVARVRRDAKFRDPMFAGKKDKRLTWEETYRETAREKEDWSDLDATLADGIEPREHRGRTSQVCVPARRSSRQPLVRQLPSSWRCMG